MKSLLNSTWWAFPLGYLGYVLFFWGIEYDPQKFFNILYVVLFLVTFHKLDKESKDEVEAKRTRLIATVLAGALIAYLTNRHPFYHS